MNRSVNIFEYTDYRKFIRDTYDLKKRKNPSFSYTQMARKGGIAARSTVKLVADGKRNLSLTMVHRFAKALDLDEKETQYFTNLVSYNQAGSDEEKGQLLQAIKKFKPRKKLFPLETMQSDYYANWYIPVTFLLIKCCNTKATPEWAQQALKNKVSLPDIKRAFALLEELKLIKNQHGSWVFPEGSVESSDEVRSLALRQFHRSMLELALQALEKDPISDREISSLTVSLDEEQFKTVKKEIKEFKKNILEKVQENKAHSNIYQINFQLFALTQLNKKTQKENRV